MNVSGAILRVKPRGRNLDSDLTIAYFLACLPKLTENPIVTPILSFVEATSEPSLRTFVNRERPLSISVWGRFCLAVLFIGCATTRYEEFGPPVEAAAPIETVAAEDPTQPVQGEVAEGQLASLERRLSELESLVRDRLDQLDISDGTLIARIAALSGQLEALRLQVGEGATPAPRKMPVAAPAEPRAESVNALYERALQAFDRQAYAEARPLFAQIMRLEPHGPLADNAQYWVGECAYATEDYMGALDAFKRVFQYVATEKDDDAQLKLGYSYLKLNDRDSALIEFTRLTVDYPDSEYLPRAQEQIRRIRAAKASQP